MGPPRSVTQMFSCGETGAAAQRASSSSSSSRRQQQQGTYGASAVPGCLGDIWCKLCCLGDIWCKLCCLGDIWCKPCCLGDIWCKPSCLGDIWCKPSCLGDIWCKRSAKLLEPHGASYAAWATWCKPSCLGHLVSLLQGGLQAAALSAMGQTYPAFERSRAMGVGWAKTEESIHTAGALAWVWRNGSHLHTVGMLHTVLHTQGKLHSLAHSE